ncbi:unnamed protein product [Parajaminaea phylloscopi]
MLSPCWTRRLAGIALVLSAANVPSAASAKSPAPSDFNVHSISVEHDLGGSLHRSNQIHLVEQPHSASAESRFFIGLSAAEAAALSWSEVNLKLGPGVQPDQRATVDLEYEGSQAYGPDAVDTTHLYSLQLPPRFLEQVDPDLNVQRSNITIAVEMAFHHLGEALPRAVAQKESPSLLWKGDAQPRALYGAGKVRVKARSPSSRVLSQKIVPARDDDKVTKSGSVITFGPFENIAPLSLAGSDASSTAQVHYTYDQPIVGIVELDRHVEVSHWGDSLAVQDKVWLRNDGPALKGHFSRVDHQVGAFYGGSGKNLLTDFAILLPSGARDAYFIDQIGNVSTSHFRPSPADASLIPIPSFQLKEGQASYLHLQPRYPLFGGWNYTFTTGWNLPLGQGGWGKKVAGTSNEYSVAVPFWNAIKDVPVGVVRNRIVLPEGATLLSVDLPFPVDSQKSEVYTTYLDTMGRTTVVLEKTKVSERHAGNVYLRYRLDSSAHLLKPLAVSSVSLALFAAGVVLRRLQSKRETR